MAPLPQSTARPSGAAVRLPKLRHMNSSHLPTQPVQQGRNAFQRWYFNLKRLDDCQLFSTVGIGTNKGGTVLYGQFHNAFRDRLNIQVQATLRSRDHSDIFFV